MRRTLAILTAGALYVIVIIPLRCVTSLTLAACGCAIDEMQRLADYAQENRPS